MQSGNYPDLDPRLRLDVAYPVGALALSNKIEMPDMLGEPDLDFPRLTGDAANGGQVGTWDTVGKRCLNSYSLRFVGSRCSGPGLTRHRFLNDTTMPGARLAAPIRRRPVPVNT
jgi:hypothetical protein